MDSFAEGEISLRSLLDEAKLDQFGQEMFALCEELWPLARSLSGQGNRDTLAVLKREFEGLEIHEVPSGTKAFDWEVPLEWNVKEAWIRTPQGNKICNWSDNNLHLVGYSVPTDKKLSLQELEKNLYSLPQQPEAIPYVTSYYNPHWGFCISDEERQLLVDGTYEVFIDAEQTNGAMSFGEIRIPGSESSEVLLSTYICHPSMANNELSGIAVALQLAKWLTSIGERKHSYRILFLPETIGAIHYLSQHLRDLQERVIAGYVLTCVGDDRSYSYVPSREGNSLADQIATHVLGNIDSGFKKYTWADRQSDERQYCAPRVNLPVASMMRTKYGAYPEYHTSLDRLGTVVTARGLSGGLLPYMRAIQVLELDFYPVVTTTCEPQLGRRNLYPTVSMKNAYSDSRLIRDLLGWADGTLRLMEIAERLNIDFREALTIAESLIRHGLLDRFDNPVDT